MNLDLRNNKDFLSGLMFIVTGLGAVFIARDYPVGSTLQMGPGYFPIALGGTCASETVDIAPSRITCESVRARRHARFAAHQASPPTA